MSLKALYFFIKLETQPQNLLLSCESGSCKDGVEHCHGARLRFSDTGTMSGWH